MNARAARRFVAYYRVSTDRQGRSGLGLEAQQKAVRDYLDGGAWEIVAEFVEVESGKRADRPELARALDACRKHKARLVIAKLDRLSRNLAFIATLKDSGVEFVAVDNPHANKLTIHILAAEAEHEREAISERTKAALADRQGARDKAGRRRCPHGQGTQGADGAICRERFADHSRDSECRAFEPQRHCYPTERAQGRDGARWPMDSSAGAAHHQPRRRQQVIKGRRSQPAGWRPLQHACTAR
jgi:DNA invertase Pin-like site-specific DNA recombinase